MKHVQELVELVIAKLETVSKSDAVVGEPIELGEVTIVPLTRLSIGMGVGGGEGEGEGFGPHGHGREIRAAKAKSKGKGVGGGSGGGATLRPVGVAIFTKEGVEVLPIADKKGLIDRIFDRVPDLVEMVQKATEGRGKGA